jgi:hypothetical protein
VPVIEVNRPDRAARRRRGKTDPVDAEAAARAVVDGRLVRLIAFLGTCHGARLREAGLAARPDCST